MMTHDKNALNTTLDEIEQVAKAAGVNIWSGEEEHAEEGLFKQKSKYF